MRRNAIAVLSLAVVVAVLVAGASASAGAKRQSASLTGAGSTFVAPLVSQWIANVGNGMSITYGPIGSGGGINAITNRTVDFGASDAPLTPDEFSACKGCVQIPWALSATSIPYNINGVKARLHLTGPVIADIFLSKITKWNDPRIKKLNRKVNLPALNITPIYRSDNSGTTFNFTDYLSRISSAWRSGPARPRHVGLVADRHRRQGQLRRRCCAEPDGRSDRIRRRRVFAEEPLHVRGREKRGREVPAPRASRDRCGCLEREATAGRQLRLDREPVEEGEARLPDLHVHLGDRAAAVLEGGRPALFIGWALTKGQSFGPNLLFQPLPKVVKNASQRTLARIHT